MAAISAPQNLLVGISPCPNDVYIFAGLIRGTVTADCPPLTFDYQDVETLNAAAQRGKYDLVKISYAAYPAVESEYELLECGGALGRGVGPLLLANESESEELDTAQEVLIPGEHTTAHFLFNFYAQYREPGSGSSDVAPSARLRKRFLPFDALYGELCNRPGQQGVVIHENRFTYQRDGLTLLQDLGAFWEDKTGRAIPLGAIAVRRGSGLHEPMTKAIRESLDWAAAHESETISLCRQHSQAMEDAVLQAHIGLYVNEYTRELGEEGREAVRFFLERQRSFVTASHQN